MGSLKEPEKINIKENVYEMAQIPKHISKAH